MMMIIYASIPARTLWNGFRRTVLAESGTHRIMAPIPLSREFIHNAQ
jgi:hypothetical protein